MNGSIKNKSILLVLICSALSVHAEGDFSDFAYIAIKSCVDATNRVWENRPRFRAPSRMKSWYRSLWRSPFAKYDSQTIQLPVMQQQGADCAFHAAFNGGNALTYALGHGDMSEQALQEAVMQNFTGLAGWKSFTEQYCNGRTTLLDDIDLGYVARELAHIPAERVTIINNIGQFNPTYQFLTEELAIYTQATEQLRTVVGSTHLFLLGTMSNYENDEGKTRGSVGHWIAVLAHRTKSSINYYVMDSMNGKNNDTLVEQLKCWV